MQNLFELLKNIFNDRVFIDVRPNNSTQTDIVIVNNEIHVHALNISQYFANIREFERIRGLLPKQLPIDTITHERNNDGSWYMNVKLFHCEWATKGLYNYTSVSDGYGGFIPTANEIGIYKLPIVDLSVLENEKGDRYNKLSTHKIYLPIDAKNTYEVNGYTTNEVTKNIMYVTRRH